MSTDVFPFECRECGEVEHGKWMERARADLAKSGLCFTCNFWHEKIGWRESGDPNAVIAEGTHYYIGQERGPGYLGSKGFGGSPFTVRFFDGREVKTTNLWCQSGIPERFRDRLPDNAEFVP